MHLWPIGTKPLGIAFARLRPFGTYEPALFHQAGAPWGHLPRQVSLRTALGYDYPPERSTRATFPFAHGDRVDTRTAFAWDERARVQTRTSVNWDDLARLELRTRVGYTHLPAREQRTSVPFGTLDPLAHRAAFYYRHPPERERRTTMPWALPPAQSVRSEIPYRHPPRKERPHTFPWDDTQNPRPGVPLRPIDPPAPPPAPDPVYTPPPGDQVRLELYCRRFDGPGNRVPIKLARVPCAGIDRRLFTVENTLTIRRVSDDAEVPATQLSMGIDYESFVWSLDATLPGPTAFELVETSSGPVEIEVTINGYAWRFYIERWMRDRRFDEPSVRISGRGITAELDAPYAAAGSLFETDTLTARQLIEQRLGATTWTATPHATFVDWTVPGETFDYRDLTPIQAITRIVNAVGARAIGRRDTRDLLLIPRYPYSPWNWDSSPVDVQIAESQAVAESGAWEPVPLSRGIYVAGETGSGVQVGVTRTGTDGAPWLPLITDPLITRQAAGRELGRNELAATGKRQIVTRSMPILTGVTEPGLLEIGQLAEVTDTDESWRGLVTAVNIQAQWTNEGLIVWQRPDLERYRDA